ncbi:MAG TPA: gluconate 2-dehydrogenase subunit 3 family protein [Devosia sp.]|jgi:gluconate 2-dehydrogenase gamma chain|nr:gluconate 2-dehydrogenase subunit 3 family protein [Devosia sp.]
MSQGLSRRDLLKAAGLSSAAAVLPGGAQAQVPVQPAEGAVHAGHAQPETEGLLFFFNDEEAQFIEAAVERLIPADPEWPGAGWAGVLYYIDRQLAAGYGAGARMYLDGPWVPDAPPQFGYQLRQSPAELYRIGIAETRLFVRERSNQQEFWDLDPGGMDRVLQALESGEAALPSIPSPVFFETLLANTIEGFFADPAYGGNRDMVGWRMVGFPGAYAAYIDVVEDHGVAFERRPISFADQQARQDHIHGH